MNNETFVIKLINVLHIFNNTNGYEMISDGKENIKGMLSEN